MSSNGKMSEAAVQILFAEHVLALGGETDVAAAAIDSECVECGASGRVRFPLPEYLAERGWSAGERCGKRGWEREYRRAGQTLRVTTEAGVGDVTARVGGRRVRAEAKGGPLVKSGNNRERVILQAAIGQLLTMPDVAEGDVLVAAVPASPKFRRLAAGFRRTPQFARTGILIALVGLDGGVEGLSAFGSSAPGTPDTSAA